MASEEITILLKQASIAQKNGDKATAIACLRQVVQRNPTNDAAWVWLGSLLADPRQAIACLQKAIEINSSNEQARLGLEWWKRQLAAQSPEQTSAQVHKERADSFGQTIDAIEEYRLAVAIEPTFLDAWLGLGAACQKLGWPDEAALAYRHILANLVPRHPQAAKALQGLSAPPSRAGTLLWSTDITESDLGSFNVSPDGQRILLSSGRGGALAPSGPGARQWGRIHLLDRCGNPQTITLNWKIEQAGLSEQSALIYATQAASAGALVAWIDPNDPATPVMQHLLQGGPPVIWKSPQDLLVTTTRADPFMAIDPEGKLLWQFHHEPYDSIKLEPSIDNQAILIVIETIQNFNSTTQVYWLTIQGQLLWHRTYPKKMSARILHTGQRVLVNSAKSLETINPQGSTIWTKAYQDLNTVYLSPIQDIVIAQYPSALEVLDTWSGRSLWQLANVFIDSLNFSLNPTTVLILRDKTTLEALDPHHGNSLWRVSLGKYGLGEAGQIVYTDSDWIAVTLGQKLITLDKNGQVTGEYRFSTRDITLQPAPQKAATDEQGRGLIATDGGRRIFWIDRTAKLVWEHAVPCQTWLAIPHSPYLVTMGQRVSGRYTLTMLRWK